MLQNTIFYGLDSRKAKIIMFNLKVINGYYINLLLSCIYLIIGIGAGFFYVLNQYLCYTYIGR
jgi:hypothetical protein